MKKKDKNNYLENSLEIQIEIMNHNIKCMYRIENIHHVNTEINQALLSLSLSISYPILSYPILFYPRSPLSSLILFFFSLSLLS